MVNQEKKKKNLEGFFLYFVVVKEKRHILGSYWFEIYGNTMTSTLSHHQDYLPIVSSHNLHIIFKLSKLGIKHFKQITIRS